MTYRQTHSTRTEHIILAVMMLVAAFLRGHYGMQIEHNVDHAYPVWQALTTLEHSVFPLAGQGTSVLFANPALTGYLYLPTVALTRSPLGAYLLVIALNTLGMLLAYRAIKSALGVRPALIALALLAVNPWIIEYSRTSWVQSLLPFFAAALAWLLWPLLLGRSKHPFRRMLLTLVMLTFYTQTYLLAFLTLLPVSLLLLIFRRHIPLRALLIGGGIFIFASLLYGMGLAGQMNTVESRLGEFSESPRRLSAEAWEHAVRLVSGADYELARGANAPPYDSDFRHSLTQIAQVVVLAALLAGICRAGIEILRRGKKHEAALILLIWFIPPILLMSYVGQPVHPFYQLIGLPAGHALAAWGLATIFRAKNRWGWRLIWVLLIPLGLLMGINSTRYYQETAATPGIDGLGALPLDYGLQLGQAIRTYLPPGGIVYADVDEWTLNSFTGRTFRLIRDTRAPVVQLIPASGGLYIQASPDQITLPPYAERAEILTLRVCFNITIDRYAPDTAITPPSEFFVATEQGLALLGYELADQDGEWTLTTFWRVEEMTPDISQTLFAPFAHIFDTSGERILIVDGQPVPGYEWQTGDLHIHRMTFTLPESDESFTLQVGQYDSQTARNLIFLPNYVPTVMLPETLQPERGESSVQDG